MKGVQHTLVYYGGRKWGGWGHTRSTDTDTGSNLECDCRGTDCYVGGSIQGGPNGVVVHPIPKYEGGDWLTFKIDFDAKTVQFEKNKELIYKKNFRISLSFNNSDLRVFCIPYYRYMNLYSTHVLETQLACTKTHPLHPFYTT